MKTDTSKHVVTHHSNKPRSLLILNHQSGNGKSRTLVLANKGNRNEIYITTLGDRETHGLLYQVVFIELMTYNTSGNLSNLRKWQLLNCCGGRF